MNASGDCLQLDVGNSSAKWRVMRAGEIVVRGKYLPADEASRDALCTAVDTPSQIWVSSVASPQAETELNELLVGRWRVSPWYARTQAQTNGLLNSYVDPSRMGVDRWLAMLAAREVIEGRVCVVDAGSALTIDIVAASGQHEGGYIMPGPALMERALLLDTDRVRFEEDEAYETSPGKSTAAAVRHGIAVAQAGAVRLVLNEMKIDDDSVLFCGGGGEALQSLLGGLGAYAPDLVFEGLGLMVENDVISKQTGLAS